ncbi:MAG TPA: tryptophan 7-halogenase [Pyrinomonadaceae bacterium]
MGARTERVVIVGGGPAGAAAAVALARGGVGPLVLESSASAGFKVGECLPPAAGPALERLGVAGLMRRDGHLPSYGNRSVWGGPEPVEHDFIFGTQGHGWQLDRTRFEATLAARCVEEGARWRYGSRLTECSRRDGVWSLRVRTPSGSETVEAEFVLDATGRAARVARRAGARRVRHDRLIGAALLFESGEGGGIKEGVTLVEAAAAGWWYSARLPGGRLMAAYMTDADLAGREVREREGWLGLLGRTEHTLRRVRAGAYSPLSGPHVLRAESSRLDAVAGEGWLALGDAAAAFDPLSSYGISSALGGGLYAAAAVLDLFAGKAHALAPYEKLVGDAYARYLLSHHHAYSLERRWAGEPFWRRRHERRTPPGGAAGR